MTRRVTAAAAVAMIAAIVALDLAAAPPNPYAAPPAFAFGSGVAPTGGFCGALPG